MPAELTVIEWKVPTDRALYLCDEHGFTLEERSPGIQAPGFHFTAYLKSKLITELAEEAAFAADTMHPVVDGVLKAAKEVLRKHFRERESTRAADLVKQWQDEKVYPFATLSMPLPINVNDLLHGKAVEWERLEFKQGCNSLDIPKFMRAMKENGSPPAEFEFDEDHSYLIVRLPVQPDAPQVASAVTEQVTGQVSGAASGLCESTEKLGTRKTRRHETSRDIPAPQHPRHIPHLPPKGSSS